MGNLSVRLTSDPAPGAGHLDILSETHPVCTLKSHPEMRRHQLDKHMETIIALLNFDSPRVGEVRPPPPSRFRSSMTDGLAPLPRTTFNEGSAKILGPRVPVVASLDRSSHYT